MLPFYMGAFHMDMDAIIRYAGVEAVDSEWKLLLMITAPFNLLKGVVVSLLTMLLYKRVSPILHLGDDRKKERKEAKKGK